MVEDFLHFIWAYQLFERNDLKAVSYESVQVLFPGDYNYDSGPDFLNAKLLIEQQVWVGNVEIHVHSSDWWKHGHHKDPAFDNLILHVVYKDDVALDRQVCLTLELFGRIDLYRLKTFEALRKSRGKIACRSSIDKVPSIIRFQAIEERAVDRLKKKVRDLELRLEENRGHWELTLFQYILIAMGSKVNKEAFDRLSRNLPFHLLLKNMDNEMILHAILFGQAGFLEQDAKDNFTSQLKLEYDFLQLKYQLKPINRSNWKFMRMRPSNFPSLRLAQFAALFREWEKIKECVFYSFNWKELKVLLRAELHAYWKDHYHFGRSSPQKNKHLGSAMMLSIMTNALIPFLFSFARHRGEKGLMRKLQDLYEFLPAEQNRITKEWDQLGIKAKNAFHSQGLIELKNSFCSFKKCLSCKIGVYILNREKHD